MVNYTSIATLSEIASTDVLVALESISILSLRDMAEYQSCRHAELLVGFHQHGTLDDLDLAHYFNQTLSDDDIANLPNLSIGLLKSLPETHADILNSHFLLNTLSELAEFDLYLEARKIIAEQAAQVFQEKPSAPNELLPNMIGSTYSAFRYSNYIKEHDVEYESYRLGFRTYADEPVPNIALMSLFYRSKARFHFGYLSLLKQRWVSAGSYLGEIIHSLALAPGESRNIAQLDWFTRQQSARSEDTTAEETLSNEFFQNRAVNEVVQSTAQEHQYGSTEIDATTKTTGFGLTAGAGGGGGKGSAAGGSAGADLTSIVGLPLNVGASGGSANNAAAAGSLGASLVHSNGKVQGTIQSETSGSREVLGQLQQNISDATVQNASNVRSLMSTVVVEDDQSGGQSSTTRNVTNYNHMHALTVQYYEVLQKYQANTHVESLSPVLYVPFRPFDFTIETIKDYWSILKTPLEQSLPQKARKYHQVIKDFSPSNGAFDTSGSIYIQSVEIVRTKVHSDKLKVEITDSSPDVKFRIGNDDLENGINLLMKGTSTYIDYKVLREQTFFDDAMGGSAGIPIAENVRFYIDASSFKSKVRGALEDIIDSASKVIEANKDFNDLGLLSNRDNLKDYVESGDYELMNPNERVDLSMDVDFVVMDESGNTETIRQEFSASYTYQQLHDTGVEEELSNATEAIESYLSGISDINATDVIDEIEQHFQLHKYGYTKFLLSYLEKEQIIDIMEHLELKGGLSSLPLTEIIDPSPLGIVDNLMIFKLKCPSDNSTRPSRLNHIFEYGTKIIHKQSGKTLSLSQGQGRQRHKNQGGGNSVSMDGYVSSHGVTSQNDSMSYTFVVEDTPDERGSYRVTGSISVKQTFGSVVRDYALPFSGLTQDPSAERFTVSIKSSGIESLLSLRNKKTQRSSDNNLRRSALGLADSTASDVRPDNVDIREVTPVEESEYEIVVEKEFGRKESLDVTAEVKDYCEALRKYEKLIKNKPLREHVFLPSAGVFGEAIIGRSNASEYIDTRRFYNWQDSPIPNSAPQILAVDLNQQRASDVADGLDATVPDSNLSATAPTQYAMPTGLTEALNAVQNGSMFRDMSKSDELSGVLSTLSEMAAQVAQTAGQLSGDAAANALNAAVQFGEQVAGLTASAMESSRAAMPSSPTEKGGTLNALDAIGDNPEPRATNPVSNLDAAKADAVGSNVRGNSGLGGSTGSSGSGSTGGGNASGGSSGTGGSSSTGSTGNDTSSDSVSSVEELEFPPVEITGSSRPWLYDDNDYTYKTDGVYNAWSTRSSESLRAHYTNPIVIAAIDGFSSYFSFNASIARDLAAVIHATGQKANGANEIYEARLLMERIWIPSLYMTDYTDLWMATLTLIDSYGTPTDKRNVEIIVADVNRNYAQDKWQEAMSIHVSDLRVVHGSMVTVMADAGTAYSDFAGKVTGINTLLGKSTSEAATLLQVFSKSASAVSLMLKIYDLAIFLVDTANNAISENTEEEKRAYLTAYSNYFEHMITGKSLPVHDGVGVTVPAEFQGYLDTLSYLEEENVVQHFESGWRSAQDYVRATVEAGGFDGLMYALAMIKQEHPNERERLLFMQRRMAQASYINYPLNSTMGYQWFRSDIKR